MNKKIGVFSGTFDPIHIGHLEACLVARAAAGLDKILVLVEKSPKRKQGVTPYGDRLYMVRLAFQHLHDVIVLDAKEDNITVKNTLPMIHKKYPKHRPVLIIGSDMLKHLDSWQDLHELLRAMDVFVILRKNSDQAETKKAIKKLEDKYNHAKFMVVPPVSTDVSSSRVKTDLAESGASEAIHREVLHYIKDKKLYSSFSGISK
jgi:nicotinate-nucleotide adenylyltransferase